MSTRTEQIIQNIEIGKTTKMMKTKKKKKPDVTIPGNKNANKVLQDTTAPQKSGRVEVLQHHLYMQDDN